MRNSFRNYLLLASSVVILAFLACTANVRAQQPTDPPTETAVPLVTATLVPTTTPIALPSLDWSDLSLYKKAMKSGFESDVDSEGDSNRYLIVARLTTDSDAIIH